MAIRDQLGELFTDEAFSAGFAARGKPGWSPGRLALVMVLQMAENLTDRQAAEAVREGDLVEVRAGNDAERPVPGTHRQESPDFLIDPTRRRASKYR